MKKIISFLMALVLACVLLACSSASITLSSDNVSIAQGESVVVTASVTGADASQVQWSSSDESIATVSSGIIKAVKVGSATITAKVGSKAATVAVTVTAPAPKITLDKTAVSVNCESTVTVTATTENTTGSVAWSTSDEKIATVNNGTITGVAVGNATITATVDGVSATVAVTVNAKPVTLPQIVVINNLDDEDSYVGGTTLQLDVTVKPLAASQEVSYESDNEDIATVDENGLVSFVGVGYCCITVTSKVKATVSYEMDCYVLAPDATEVQINGADTVMIEGTTQLSASVLPALANQAVTWNTSDATIASIDNQGVVTGISEGTVTITATSKSTAGILGQKDIQVVLPAAEQIIVANLNAVMMEGESSDLEINILPALADQNVKLVSSDETVAKFEGLTLKALKEGTATITINTSTEGVKYEVELKVVKAISADLSQVVICDLGNAARYDEVKVDGKSYYAGLTAFDSLSAALATAQEGETITVTAGTWSMEGSLAVNNVTIVGPNKDIDPNTGTRVTPAVLTGQLSLSDDTDTVVTIDGITFNGLDFVEDAQIFAKNDTIYNFTLEYCSVYNYTRTAGTWTEENVSNFNGFLVMACTSNTARYQNITVSHNLFDGIADEATFFSRLDNLTITDNVYHNIGFDCIRVDGGYIGGTHTITGNTFKNDTQSGHNAIYYKSCSSDDSTKIHTVIIKNNSFENIGTPGETGFNGAISFFRYQENGLNVTIQKNNFKNCVNLWYIRTNGANEANYSVDISLNKIEGEVETYIYMNLKNSDSASTNASLVSIHNNLFINNNGEVYTPDKTKVFNAKEFKDCYTTVADYEAALLA